MDIRELGKMDRPCVATVGFFDGVHRGHRHLLSQVGQLAGERGLASAVVTFPTHPRKVLHADFQPQLLTSYAEKLRLLEDTGVDYCIPLNFTPALSLLTAREFMALLREQCLVQVLVVGYDHRFGHDRAEGYEDYVRHGRELGMEVVNADGLRSQSADGMVSSSLIRRLLQGGQVRHAASLLGYDYFLSGRVTAGHHVGHALGYPTANILPDDADKLVPADGVYAVRVEMEGREYGGMLNIGHRPTLANGTDRSIEVHLFHFDADAYGQSIKMRFVQRTRDELRFGDTGQLREQLRRDEQEIMKILST